VQGAWTYYIWGHILVFDVLAFDIDDDVDQVIALGPGNWRRNQAAMEDQVG